jgi:hypothetical protein
MIEGEYAMPTTEIKPGRSTLSRELSATLHPIKEARLKFGAQSGRFDLYDFLKIIYRVYGDWKRGKARMRTRALADQFRVVRRKGMSPIRVLIEASLPKANSKQKSRWVRALQYIYSEDVPPSKFRRFIRSHGGIAGCARQAVRVNRKRSRPGGDWND